MAASKPMGCAAELASSRRPPSAESPITAARDAALPRALLFELLLRVPPICAPVVRRAVAEPLSSASRSSNDERPSESDGVAERGAELRRLVIRM